MKRRPLDRRFNEAVLSGRKFTTIRRKPWPVGEDIMLYNWCGVPYRKGSTHVMVACIRVTGLSNVMIKHHEDGGMMYDCGILFPGKEMHETEGFSSREEMDEWFRKVVPKGGYVEQALMRFRLRYAVGDSGAANS